ncbi:hypothetical protein [Rhodopirellula sallentina]|uniref:hypothetical protein n=1 Tax=Rhodopirellula sallentina TaxID=1263869 RepID=UPI001181AF2A|nr:hypothetical protein [Rhodopirellula sallentina]
MNPHDARRNVVSMIKSTISAYGLEVAASGGKFEDLRQSVDPSTGYWSDSSYNSKPSRLLVHLHHEDDKIVASIPDANSGRTFSYANAQGNRSVGCIVVRLMVILAGPNGDFKLIDDWEWLLWYCFLPALPSGTSGEVFNNFFPSRGTFNYQGQPCSYISAGLVGLSPSEELREFPNGEKISYAVATESLSEFIRVNVEEFDNSESTGQVDE